MSRAHLVSLLSAVAAITGCSSGDRALTAGYGSGGGDQRQGHGPLTSYDHATPGQSVNRGFGLTFAPLAEASLPQGTAHLSCHGVPHEVDQPHAGSCNPYAGDTQCAKEQPVLCVHRDGSHAPSGYPFGFYNGWVEGELASTAPVAGTSLVSRADTDALCRAELGEGWAMAEFHDAHGGWGLVGNASPKLDAFKRHWVFIDDQPGNCWNRVDAFSPPPPPPPPIPATPLR